MRTRGHDLQKGQAIVLIALLLIVLIGMLGLAIDAGRAYVDRRQLQDAVDAAALGAGDNYENYRSVASAQQWAEDMFAKNESLPAPDSIGTCGAGCAQASWISGYTFQITVTPTNFNGNFFAATATHGLALTFMQALGAGPQVQVGAAATSITGNQRAQPALLTLDTSCSSLTVGGNTTLTVKGDIYSNGCATLNGNPSLGVAGSFYTANGNPPAAAYLCYSANPATAPYAQPCQPGDTFGGPVGGAQPLPDPGYPSLGFSLYNNPALIATNHGTWTEDYPGDYGGVAIHGGGCYFLDPGIYIIGAGGYDATGALTSNELKPPDEALWNDGSQPAAPQFWDAGGCPGHFSVANTNVGGGNGVGQGNGKCLGGPGTNCWGVALTSRRTDTYAGTPYTRASSPSFCREVSVDNSGTLGIKVTISQNAPGAQSYSVYVNPNGCKGTTGAAFDPTSFGFAHNFPVSDAVPYNLTLDKTFIPGTYLGIQCFPSTLGCSLPDPEVAPQCFTNCPPPTVPPQEVPPRKLFPGGDRADENACYPQSGARPGFPCDGSLVTPGAVQFYMAAGCLTENGNGFTWIFSGYQYNWIVIYQPVSNTGCGNKLNGGANTSYIGTIYTPRASWQINGNDHAPLSGQVVCFQATVNGNSTVGINFNPDFAPAPPASRLVY